MAVFTEVSLDEARAFVARLNVGTLTALRGITAGIENTNYFVTTDRGEWVLTIFERLTFEQLPFYLHLMKHLARKGIPVPEPRADASGEILHTLKGKPAALVDKLAGRHQLAPDDHHCAQVGEMLARMHLAGLDYPRHQPNLRGLAWWTETVPVVLPFVDAAQRELLTSELAFQQELAASAAYAALPRGPIHADLFRDNVMFDGLPGRERLTGFFDFYFAGVDTFLFDLAVCLNDWCVDLASGRGVDTRAAVFVAAYERVRPLTGGERRLLPALLRAAAFRFWLSRLWDLHLPRDASLLQPHDPTHFERVLRERIATPWHPPPAE
ncbi:homoserine kinase [Calidifontimicrobium sp. SYSU G02091]|uniref:homoserine kinase n=1 Tax=Calidifontimicrobium sp. SYSU G02091 TaxID=2926421 RepID=UPI001F52CB2E|nr:homoserine kinase [Calidifontimicrobium sp. SYSU G02091]MCI1193489.1 homoserine kinase [Calidifontimicrobium sp. SYSU G02091]